MGMWHGSPLVFITYRSHDASPTAFTLYREITHRFGRNVVFRDSDSLPAGVDFAPRLLDDLRGCAVLLAVVGPRWLEENGDGRLIDSPDDWVRREITEALAQGIRVVPVFVGDTPGLTEADLPEPIRVIARHQSVRIRNRDERPDIDALLDKLAELEPRLFARDRSRASSQPAATRVLGARGRLVTTPERRDEAGELLAAQVFEQALAAVASWQLDTPKVVTRWEFEQPGAASRTWTSGDAHSVADLARRVASLPRTRLAILGDAGSGKTSLAVLLVRELAKQHTRGDRVPVLLPLAGWDPAEPLAVWITGRLVKDYPALRAPEFGVDAAAALVRDRRVLPVLDGFDELPPAARQRAMDALGRLTDEDAWILTSRREEFASAGSARGAEVDATLTAQPLSPAEAAEYLRRMVGDDVRWQPVLCALTDEPLATAMRTPLSLWLVARTYVDRGEDPVRLGTFADADDVRRHLLDELVPSLLETRLPGDGPFQPRRRWPVANTRRWLANLAGADVVEWWALGLGPRHPRRVLAVVLALLAALPVGAVGLVTSGAGGLAPAAVFTVLFGVVATLVPVADAVPAFASFRLRGRVAGLLAGTLEGMLAGVLLAGLFYGGARVADLLAPGYFLSLSPTAALATGLGLGVGVSVIRWARVPTRLQEARTPRVVLHADRTLTVAAAAASAAVACVFAVYSLEPAFPAHVPLGLASFPVWFAWAAYSPVCGRSAWPGYVLTVGWAAASGRLPFRLMPFLADMHRMGVLNQVGAVYRFRHQELRRSLLP
jgi:hypothetical protein